MIAVEGGIWMRRTMIFSVTLTVRRMPRPKLMRVGVLPEIKIDTENIRTRSSRKISSLSMAVRWSNTQMMQDVRNDDHTSIDVE